MRISIILLALLPATLSGQTKYERDFDEFWNLVNENYAYFNQQNIDWNKVREIYQPQAEGVTSQDEFVSFLEQVINELYNGHSSLNTNLNSSNRIIPSGSDLFVKKAGDTFVISDVRRNSASEKCGLKPGMNLVSFNEKAIEPQLKQFLPKYTESYNEAMYEYAVNMLFAGTHDKERKIAVSENNSVKTYLPDRSDAIEKTDRVLEYKILDKNTGYININNSLGNNKLIEEFDHALDSLMKTDKLIIDISETPGGGNSAVARAMMGRFIEKEMPYQRHECDETAYCIRRSWIEFVSPRAPVYKQEVIVLVGHWTGSMGEGIAIGFDGLKRAKIVGTPMAGLIGAIDGFRLSQTQIGFQIPTERLFHINGTPREKYQPNIRCSNIYESWEKIQKMCGIGK